MRRRTIRRNRPTRRRRSQGAQAILEMALVIPIMMALVFNFLAVMILLKGQNQLQAAVSLASQATIVAPVHDPHNSCTYATKAFRATMTGAVATAAPGCGGASDPFSDTRTLPANSGMVLQPGGLKCTNAPGNAADYLTGAGYPLPPAATIGPAVQCSASVKFNFGATPIGAFVFWTPTISVTAAAVPTAVRQCEASLAVC